AIGENLTSLPGLSLALRLLWKSPGCLIHPASIHRRNQRRRLSPSTFFQSSALHPSPNPLLCSLKPLSGPAPSRKRVSAMVILHSGPSSGGLS
ncbi:hypothetical protein ANANG_G00015280, partial [Anguilla anguilla]